MKTCLFSFVLAFCLNAVCFSQSCYKYITKEYNFGGSVDIDGTCITKDSFVYTVGNLHLNNNNEALLVKTSIEGDVLWTRILTGSNSDEFNGLNTTSDGGCIAIGHTSSYAGTTSYALLAVRFDKNGNVLWSKAFNTNSTYGDIGYSALQTSDGGFVIVGNQNANGFTASSLAIKTDADGNALWLKRYNNIEGGEFENALEVADGYLLAGEYLAAGNTTQRAIIVKLNKETGNLVFLKSWANPTYSMSRSRLFSNGTGFYLASILNDNAAFGVGNCRQMITYLNNDLVPLKTLQVNHPVAKNHGVSPIGLFPDGSIVSGLGGTNLDGDLYRINSAGSLDWKAKVQDDGSQEINGISTVGSKLAVFAGTNDHNTSRKDMLMVFAQFPEQNAAFNSNCKLLESEADLTMPVLSDIPFAFDAISDFPGSAWTSIAPSIQALAPAVSYNCSNSNCLLPMQLVSFHASLLNNSYSKLTFTTTQDENVAYYEIERSYDGRTFQGITKLSPMAGSQRAYEYVDYDILKTTDKAFYRIRTKSLNGETSYSSLVILNIGNQKLKISVLPNPAKGFAQLNIDADRNGMASIRVFDMAGKTILEQNSILEKGNNAVAIQHMELLKTGTYIISVSTEDRVQTLKLVIE